VKEKSFAEVSSSEVGKVSLDAIFVASSQDISLVLLPSKTLLDKERFCEQDRNTKKRVKERKEGVLGKKRSGV